MLLPDDERVYAFTRRLGDDELLVLGNFTGEDAAGRAAGGRRRARARQLRRRRRGARAAPVGGARAAADGMTPIEIDTPHGPALAHLHAAEASRAARSCSATARAAAWRRATSARTKAALEERRERRARRAALPRGGPQVAGAREQLDAAWVAVVEHLRGDVFAGLPARHRRALGGRPRRVPHGGGRRARRACSASPSRSIPPGKPEKTRLDELDAVDGPGARRPGRERPVRHAAGRAGPRDRRPCPARTLTRRSRRARRGRRAAGSRGFCD